MPQVLLRAPTLVAALLLLLPTTGEAHPFADVVTSASRSVNPSRACDFDRDGAVRNDRYCRCNDQSRAGPGNYDRRGSREFCACDPSIQHCDPDGTYSDGTPRFRWTIDCNDFDANAYPQHCAPVDCNANYEQHPHCAGVEDGDGDGFTADDCDDANPAIHPGATDICGDGIDQDCDGADLRCPAADRDGDGFTAEADGGDDCDDGDPSVHPGAVDRCGDGTDSDCDGTDPVCAADRDRDGHEDAAAGGDDCDDLDSSRYPGAPEVPGDGIDQDCDGADATAADVDADGDGFAPGDGGDCDDGDATRYPGAPERCGDGVDQNCDGVDLDCAAAADLDGDGYPAGEDCDDRSSAIHPGATEICGNGEDEDCDGLDVACDGDLDGGVATLDSRRTTNRGENPSGCDQASGPAWSLGLIVLLIAGLRRRRGALWLLPLVAALPAPADAGCIDLDGDGHQVLFFDQCGDDCNDLDPAVHPGADEICGDGADQDCDGQIDEGCAPADADGDGHAAVAAGGDDCDDGDATVHPGAAEICGDRVDQDCSGADLPCPVDAGVPDAAPGPAPAGGDDVDGDGHRARASGGDDCDDLDASAYPGAPERCGDDRDQDCDGADLPCDRDGDGFPAGEDCNDFVATISPDGVEVCGDGIDQDCDGADLACADLPVEDDADGDGHRSVARGGDDCQDYDRATFPGAPEICGDGVDQDCDGADAPCTAMGIYIETDADPFVRQRASAEELPSGSGVPPGPTTGCAAVPGQAGGLGGGAALLLLLLGARRRRSAAVLAALPVVAAFTPGCGEVENPAEAEVVLDAEFYAAFVDPILARGCATLACHGNTDRPLHLFSVSRLRATGRDGVDTELTDAELCRNLAAVSGFADPARPLDSLVLAKPLYLEDGGTWHGGGYHFGPGDAEYACLVRWLRGERATADSDGRLVDGCTLDWNLAGSGEPVVPTRRNLVCD
ncbi:MAG: putative metal-binding motif-containing protein [bacterium]